MKQRYQPRINLTGWQDLPVQPVAIADAGICNGLGYVGNRCRGIMVKNFQEQGQERNG